MRKGQRKCNMQQYKITQGFPFPLGATKTQNGWNFSIFSEKAPTLVIKDQSQKLNEISFDPQRHHIGNIWHIGITSEENTIHYFYKVEYNNAPIYIQIRMQNSFKQETLSDTTTGTIKKHLPLLLLLLQKNLIGKMQNLYHYPLHKILYLYHGAIGQEEILARISVMIIKKKMVG